MLIVVCVSVSVCNPLSDPLPEHVRDAFHFSGALSALCRAMSECPYLQTGAAKPSIELEVTCCEAVGRIASTTGCPSVEVSSAVARVLLGSLRFYSVF